MPDLYAVIMAGGSGTRFWPRSRAHHPKQLLRLGGEEPLVTATFNRLAGLVPPERVLVLTNQEQLHGVAKCLPAVPPDQILAEPARRDTAACIGLAATWIARRDPNAVMAVLPSDHRIQPEESFRRALSAAHEWAAQTRALITFGLVPDRPATAYGYIERGEEAIRPPDVGATAYRVAAFREKPDQATARKYLKNGGFYWNSGVFVFPVEGILDAFQEHLPEHFDRLRRIQAAWGTAEEAAVIAVEFPGIPRISIDYGIMERADNILVLPVVFGWNDLGSWEAVRTFLPRDRRDNAVRGRHLQIDTSGCTIDAGRDGHLIATIGVENLVIVHTPDATLVCPRDRVQDVKRLTAQLAAEGPKGLL